MNQRLVRLLAAVWLGIGLASGATVARAADTTEPFDLGASNLDLYLGAAGLGLRQDQVEVGGSTMLGYGLAERFSAMVGGDLVGNGYLADGAATLFGGVYGTVVESDHLDWDLFLVLAGGAEAGGQLVVAPSFELNLDLAPDRQSWGVYVRGGLAAAGQREAVGVDEARWRVSLELPVEAGSYLTVADGHQLLIEGDFVVTEANRGRRAIEAWGIALGYNVQVTEVIELINELGLDIPRRGEPPAASVSFGFIATLP